MSDAGLTLPDEVTPTSAKPKTNIFRGPHGIRAGWRALISLAILATLVFLLSSALRLLCHGRITFGYNHGLTPFSVALTDGIIFLCQSVAAIIMGRIERPSASTVFLESRHFDSTSGSAPSHVFLQSALACYAFLCCMVTASRLLQSIAAPLFLLRWRGE